MAKVLSTEEFNHYFRKWKSSGDISIRDKLLEHNYALVYYIINKHFAVNTSRSVIDRDDLFQSGTIGLMKALDKYDPDKSSFSTYAGYWIVRQIQLDIAKNYFATAVPKDKYGILNNYLKLRSQNLSKEEIAEGLGIPLKDVALYESMNYESTTLTYGMYDQKEAGNEVVDETDDIIDRVHMKDCSKIVRKLVNEDAVLSKQQKKLLMDHFYNDNPMPVIRDNYGISIQRAHQIKSKLLSKLRNELEAVHG